LQRIVSAILFCLLALAPANADVRIVSSPGGEVREYLEIFELLRRSGERIVIDGPCLSACTLLLSTIPHNRICVTPRAVLGFHAARWIDQAGRTYAAADETRMLVATYPEAVQAWIKRRGGLKQKAIFLRGRELAALYPRCS
jgi:ATP-dependent protease ClpP protease subunit